MSDSTAPPQSEGEEKPKRNPTERIIVWGVISVGVIIACVDGFARYGYTTTLPVLQARMVEDDAAVDARSLTLAEADKLIAGNPSRTEESDKVIYRWKGLVKDHGAIHLSFDKEKVITGLETDAPPEVPVPELPPTVESEIIDPMSSMPGGGSGSGGENGGEGDPPQSPRTEEAAPTGDSPTSTPEPIGTEAKPEAKPDPEAEAETKPAPEEE